MITDKYPDAQKKLHKVLDSMYEDLTDIGEKVKSLKAQNKKLVEFLREIEKTLECYFHIVLLWISIYLWHPL